MIRLSVGSHIEDTSVDEALLMLEGLSLDVVPLGLKNEGIFLSTPHLHNNFNYINKPSIKY